MTAPRTRTVYCMGCPPGIEHMLEQTERSPGIWRPWLCPRCEQKDRERAEQFRTEPAPRKDAA